MHNKNHSAYYCLTNGGRNKIIPRCIRRLLWCLSQCLILSMEKEMKKKKRKSSMHSIGSSGKKARRSFTLAAHQGMSLAAGLVLHPRRSLPLSAPRGRRIWGQRAHCRRIWWCRLLQPWKKERQSLIASRLPVALLFAEPHGRHADAVRRS